MLQITLTVPPAGSGIKFYASQLHNQCEHTFPFHWWIWQNSSFLPCDVVHLEFWIKSLFRWIKYCSLSFSWCPTAWTQHPSSSIPDRKNILKDCFQALRLSSLDHDNIQGKAWSANHPEYVLWTACFKISSKHRQGIKQRILPKQAGRIFRSQTLKEKEKKIGQWPVHLHNDTICFLIIWYNSMP